MGVHVSKSWSSHVNALMEALLWELFCLPKKIDKISHENEITFWILRVRIMGSSEMERREAEN